MNIGDSDTIANIGGKLGVRDKTGVRYPPTGANNRVLSFLSPSAYIYTLPN